MSNGTDALVITYPITYKRANGVEETISISQVITKVKGAVRTASVTLYKWAIAAPTAPSGTFSYTWDTATFTLPSTNTAGWEKTPGASSPGYNLYRITQSFVDYGSETTTTGISWTNTEIGVAGFAGANGNPGSAGSPGARGSVTRYSTATANWNGITSTYVDTITKNIVDLFPSSTLIAGDYVTIKGPTAVMTKYYNGSAWVDPGQFIDGNLFVTETITANKIDTRGLSIKDASGNIILQAGSSFLGGTPYFDVPDSEVGNAWYAPAIYLRLNGENATGVSLSPGGAITVSANLATSADSQGQTSAIALVASTAGNSWKKSAWIFHNGTNSTRYSCSIILPSDIADMASVFIQHYHQGAGGAGNTLGPWYGTVYAKDIMIEPGLVATTFKLAAISPSNRITAAKSSTYIESLDAGRITTGTLSAQRIDNGDGNVNTGLTFALGTSLNLSGIGAGGVSGSLLAAGSFKAGANRPFALVTVNENSNEGYGLISARKNDTGGAIATWGGWNGFTDATRVIKSSSTINNGAIGAIFGSHDGTTNNYYKTKVTIAEATSGTRVDTYNSASIVKSTWLQYLNSSITWGLYSDSPIKTTDTTSSTNTSTGALVISGGAGIGGNLNVGGNLAVTGTFTPASMSLSSTTNSTSQSTGALSVAGGVGIAKDVYIGPEVASSIFTKMKTTLASGNASFESRSVDAQGLSYNLVKLGLYDSNLTGLYILGVDRAGNLGPGGASAGNTSTYYNSIQSGIWYALYNTAAGRIKLTGNSSGTTVIEVGGSITATGTITPFTGSHDGFTGDTPEIGDIVVDDICLLHKDVYNTVFKVEMSSLANQKAVVGVCANISVERPNRFADGEEFFIDPLDLDGLNYIIFNSVGEGQINVCGENGNIEKGDLIVTSSIPGKGMRQSDDIVRSYTVAKARESVSFSSPSEVKMIACIYMCG
jgi:hypothetical protein